MKTWKILLICFAVLFAIVLGSNIVNGNRRQLPTQQPAVVTPTPPPEVETIDKMLQTFRRTATDWKVSASYDPETRIARFIFINPEFTEETILLAKALEPMVRENWDENVAAMIDLQKEVSRIMEDQGHEDVTVVLDMVNPDNPDEVWVSVANGIAGYDVVRGIDLLNGQS